MITALIPFLGLNCYGHIFFLATPLISGGKFGLHLTYYISDVPADYSIKTVIFFILAHNET